MASAKRVILPIVVPLLVAGWVSTLDLDLHRSVIVTVFITYVILSTTFKLDQEWKQKNN
jgi:hypothetical protein